MIKKKEIKYNYKIGGIKMFKSRKEVSKLTIDNIIHVEGYEAGGKNMFVAQVDDLVLFTGFNAKKPGQGVRALVVTAKIPPKNEAFEKYGSKIIVVDKRFNKLPKKQRLALLEIENQKLQPIDTRLNSNVEAKDILSTNADRKIAAELMAMEKYGHRPTARAITKNNKRMVKSEKVVGKQLFKNMKKTVKGKSSSIVPDLEMPITLENA